MNELARRPLPHMTTDEFLLWPGDGSGRRFQLVDGEVRAIPTSIRIHGVIQARIAFLLWEAVRTLPLHVLIRGAIIPAVTADDNVRLPNVIVAPNNDLEGDQIVPDPVVVVEILSPGNSAAIRENVRACATLASVQDIVVIETVRMAAEVYSRDDTGKWMLKPAIVEQGDRLEVHSIGLNCPIEAVYADTWMTRPDAGA